MKWIFIFLSFFLMYSILSPIVEVLKYKEAIKDTLFYTRSENWRFNTLPIWAIVEDKGQTIRLVECFGVYPDKVTNKMDFVKRLSEKFYNST